MFLKAMMLVLESFWKNRVVGKFFLLEEYRMKATNIKSKWAHIDRVMKMCEENSMDDATDAGEYFLDRYKQYPPAFVFGAIIMRLNEVIDDEKALRKCLLNCSEKMEMVGSAAHPGRKKDEQDEQDEQDELEEE